MPGLVPLHRQAGINWPRSSCIPNTSSWRGILVRNRRQAGCSEAGRQALGWAYLSFTTILHEAGSAWKETKAQRCEGTLARADSSSLCFQSNASACSEFTSFLLPQSPVLGGRPRHQSGQQHSGMKSRCGRGASETPGLLRALLSAGSLSLCLLLLHSALYLVTHFFSPQHQSLKCFWIL